ncbi:Maf family protein [Bacteriovoracaceae bacterium]|nr:Maf family protein [Bacteriovoracaceae bacterium]
MKLILGSSSPYRLELLKRLGVSFTTESPNINEDDWKDLGPSPDHLVSFLAVAKARDIYLKTDRENVVIGSDQVAVFESRVLGKPGNRENAIEQLELLSNGEHALMTGVCVMTDNVTLLHTDVTKLRMRNLSKKQIERYLDRDEPYDCAGSYKLEEGGISLFEKIETEDYTAICGLPLMAVTKMLHQCGLEV